MIQHMSFQLPELEIRDDILFPPLSRELISDIIEKYADVAALNDEFASLHELPGIDRSPYRILKTTYSEYPWITWLVGLLREQAFRTIGGGVGAIDLDTWDLDDTMDQIISLNLEADTFADKIVGGYRTYYHASPRHFQHHPMAENTEYSLETKRMKIMQPGRSFLNTIYVKSRYGFYSLFVGLAYALQEYGDVELMLGKITVPYSYGTFGVSVLHKYFTSHWDSEHGLFQVSTPMNYAEFPNVEIPLSINKHWLKKFLEQHGIPYLPVLDLYRRLVESEQDLLYGGMFHHKEFNAYEFAMGIRTEAICDVIESYTTCIRYH